MNPQSVDRKRSYQTAAGVVIITLLAVAFLWLAHRRDAVQRQAEAVMARQTQAERERQKAAPSWGRWQQVGMIATEMQQPVALAWTPKYLYVAGDRAISAFYLGNGWEYNLVLQYEPTALWADEKRIVVGFRDGVAVYSAKPTPAHQGRARPVELQPVVRFGERAYVTGVAMVGDELWVADAGNRTIWRLRGTKVLGQLGQADQQGYEGLIVPSPHLDLARTPEGNVLVNNPGRRRVETWSPSGKLLGQFGKTGMEPDSFSGCCNPIAVAALPDGRIVTAEKGLVRVGVYRPDGTFEGPLATTPALSRGARSLDVATTADGRVLVLDPRAKSVLTFDETATEQTDDGT